MAPLDLNEEMMDFFENPFLSRTQARLNKRENLATKSCLFHSRNSQDSSGWSSEQQYAVSLHSCPKMRTHSPKKRGLKKIIHSLKWILKLVLSQNKSSGGHSRAMSEPLLQSQYSWPVITCQRKCPWLNFTTTDSSKARVGLFTQRAAL